MILLQRLFANKQILSVVMGLLIILLICFSVALLAILLWFVINYQKYKRQQRNLIALLLLMFPATLSAQYHDENCNISFKWLDNQPDKLEHEIEGIYYRFIPSSTKWEIILSNNTDDEALVNWQNTQLIINGKASLIEFGNAELQSVIGSHAEISQTLGALTPTEKKTQRIRIYDKSLIQKGRNAAVTIILPVSVGNQPKFTHTFDFIITRKP